MKVYMENKNHIHIESNKTSCELVLAAEVKPDSSLVVDLKVQDNLGRIAVSKQQINKIV